MKIVKKQVTMSTITVEVQRTVKVGMYLNMAPSEGYMGIDLGKVIVNHIGYLEDLYADPEVPSDVADIIGAHIEGEVDSLPDDVGEDEHRKIYDDLHNGVWVVYKYMTHDTTEVSALPLDMFLSHTSTRY